MAAYLLNLVYAVNMLAMAVLGGARYETISARAYTLRLAQHPFLGWLAGAIDAALGVNHCREAWQNRKK